MKRRGRKVRKTDHNTEEVDLVKPKSNDDKDISESTNAQANIPTEETQSTTDATTEKFSHPLVSTNQQLEEVETEPGHRKRHGSPVDVEPKKFAPSLETTPAPAETGAYSVNELLQGVENLNIDHSGRDYRLQGAIPRPQPEILVVRDPSGYVNAQAAFHVPQEAVPGGSGEGAPGRSGEGAPGRSGEGAPGRSGEGAPGRSGEGAPGRSGKGAPGRSGKGAPHGSGEGAPHGSGEGVPHGSGEGAPHGSLQSVPIITIVANEESYAKTITDYNDTIPNLERELAQYRHVIEAIPEYVQCMRNGYMTLFSRSAFNRDTITSFGCLQLEGIQENLQTYVPLVEDHMNGCIRIAGILMEIYSADSTSPRPNHFSGHECQLLHDLKKRLLLLIPLLDICRSKARKFNRLRRDLHTWFPK